MAQISPPEASARNHPRRAALYEVVGGGHSDVRPHFAAIPYQPGDRFLICSDGLIDGVIGVSRDEPEFRLSSAQRRLLESIGDLAAVGGQEPKDRQYD